MAADEQAGATIVLERELAVLGGRNTAATCSACSAMSSVHSISSGFERARSISRLRATVVSHAAGKAGSPSRGQRSAARASAPTALLPQVEVAAAAREYGEYLAVLLAHQAVERGAWHGCAESTCTTSSV